MNDATNRKINGLEKIALVFLSIYFIWYSLPIMRAYFGSYVSTLFFYSLLLAGISILIVNKVILERTIALKLNYSVVVVLMVITMFVMSAFDICDAKKYLSVIVSFWGTLFVYELLDNSKNAQKWLGKLLCILFVITVLTSTIGTIFFPNASRIIASGISDINEQTMLTKFNIAGVYLYQAIVLLVPVWIGFFFKGYKRILCVICIIFSGIAILYSAFSISIIMFCAALGISIIFLGNEKKTMIIGIVILLLLLLVPWQSVFSSIIEQISNVRVAERMKSVLLFLNGGEKTGDLNMRMEVYRSSWETFCHNVNGIGPFYSFVMKDHGIGYHSQILDDMARYGIFAILFYVIFLTSYCKKMVLEWNNIGLTKVARIMILLYIIFLFLNIGFRSPQESIVILYIIRVIPDLVRERQNRHGKREESYFQRCV